MSSHVETVNITAGLGAGYRDKCKIRDLVHVNVSIHQLLNQLLFFTKAIVEYGFGMYVGAFVGGLLGWHTGNVYVEHFEPVHFSDFAELNRILQWSLAMPYEFASTGRLIGLIAGVIAIMLINGNLLTQRISSLYEKGVTDPKSIAEALGKNVLHIQRKLSKLARNGKNSFCAKAEKCNFAMQEHMLSDVPD